MGYEIHRWLMDQLPAECSILERAVAAQIAIRADDTTRETWPTLEDLARWTGAKNEASVRDALKGLALRGWELRVVIGQRAKDGRKVYAVQGKKLTFRVPLGPAVDPGREPRLSTKEPPLSTKERGASTRESGLAPETKRPSETNRDLGSDTSLRSVSGAQPLEEVFEGELLEPSGAVVALPAELLQAVEKYSPRTKVLAPVCDFRPGDWPNEQYCSACDWPKGAEIHKPKSLELVA